MIRHRRTRHTGHCWKSRDELISDVLLWTPTHGRAKAERPARTNVQHLCVDTECSPEDLPEAMNDREGWWEQVRDIRADGTTRWWMIQLYQRSFSFSIKVSLFLTMFWSLCVKSCQFIAWCNYSLVFLPIPIFVVFMFVLMSPLLSLAAVISPLLLFTPLEFFTAVLPDGFSLEFAWQQVPSSLQDLSQDSGRSQQCCHLDSLYLSSNFQVFQAF